MRMMIDLSDEHHSEQDAGVTRIASLLRQQSNAATPFTVQPCAHVRVQCNSCAKRYNKLKLMVKC